MAQNPLFLIYLQVPLLSFTWHQNKTAKVIINCPMCNGIIIFNGSTLNGVARPLGRAGRVDNGASSIYSLHRLAPYNNY